MDITKQVKAISRKNFDGSDRLFDACWRQYTQWLKSAIDDPTCQDDIDNWLHSIASEKVNNPRSKFYIYG